MHQHFVGLDLHSTNTFIGICDEGGRRVMKQRTVNNLDIIQSFLEKNNIYSRGRFGGWKYEIGNMDHSVLQGMEIVDRIVSNKEETVYRF